MGSKAYLVAAPSGKGFAVTAEDGTNLPQTAVTWQFRNMDEAHMARRIACARFREVRPDYRWGIIDLPGAVVGRECKAAADAIDRLRKLPEPPEPGKILLDLIDRWGVPRMTIADVTGASPPTIGRWISGELEPSWTHLARLRMFAQTVGFPWSDDEVFGSSPTRKPQRRVPESVEAEA